MGGSSGIVRDRRIDLSMNPCPSVNAYGLGGVALSSYQFWLEVEYEVEALESERELPGYKRDRPDN